MSETKGDANGNNGLRDTFCSAANYLTQLYMTSLRQEKIAYKEGYCEAMDAVCQWVAQQGSHNLSARGLIEFALSSKAQMQNISSASIENTTTPRLSSSQAPHPGSRNSRSTNNSSQHEEDEEEDGISQSNVSNLGTQFSSLSTNSTLQDPHSNNSLAHPPSTLSSVPHQGVSSLPNPSTSFSTNFTLSTPPPSSQSNMFQFSAPPSSAPGSTPLFGPSQPQQQQPQQSSLPFSSSNVTPRPSNPRKRRFFEFLFDSPSGATDVQNALHPLFIDQHQRHPDLQANVLSSTTTTTTSAGLSGHAEGLAMDVLDYSDHPQSWKKSRLGDTVMISNNG